MATQEDVNTTPVSLEKVEVFGADAYSPEYIQSIIKPLLQAETQSVGDIVTEGNKVVRQLTYLGGFTDAKLQFDVDAKAGEKYDELNQKQVNIVGKIDLTPLKQSNLSISSVHNELGNALRAGYLNRNVLGNGENLGIDFALNLFNNSKTFDALLSKPLADTSYRAFGHINVSKTEESLFQSKSQDATSAELGVTKQKFCKHSGALTTASTGLNLVRRNINHIDDSANDEVKMYAGDSQKESLFFNVISSNMKYLTTSDCTLPLEGHTISITNELAGFPSLVESLGQDKSLEEITADGKDQFFKLGLGLDMAKSFFGNSVTFSSNLKCGSIINFAALQGNTVNFQDKFYPAVSGYALPIAPQHAVGAGSFASYNIGISTKAGLMSADRPLRMYTSLNGASSTNELDGLSLGQLKSLTNDWKHGVDVGFLYSTGDANAKLFWKRPLAGKNDIGKVGFEVDIAGNW